MAGDSSAGPWATAKPRAGDRSGVDGGGSTGPDRPAGPSQRQGCQYTSLDFTNRLHELGLVPSYGSTGDCYDNAAMETFWATLKRELSWIHGPLIYMNRARLRSALFDYIEIFYNRERAQAGLGHLSPS